MRMSMGCEQTCSIQQLERGKLYVRKEDKDNPNPAVFIKTTVCEAESVVVLNSCDVEIIHDTKNIPADREYVEWNHPVTLENGR